MRKVNGFLIGFLLATSASSANMPAEAPPFMGALGSVCNRHYDDTVAELGAQIASYSSEASLGRLSTPPPREWEQFRQTFADCRLYEDAYEGALLNPQGDASAAKADFDRSLRRLQDLSGAIGSGATFRARTSIDTESNQFFVPRLKVLANEVRLGAKYMQGSDRLRSSVHSLAAKVLQASVDCRNLDKTGNNSTSCRLTLNAMLTNGEAQIRAKIKEVAPSFMKMGNTLEAASADRDAAISRVAQLRSLLPTLNTQLQQLHAQAPVLDYYQKAYRYWGDYYWNQAYYYFWWGNNGYPSLIPSGWVNYHNALYFWWWHGYYNHAFTTVVYSLIPNLMAVISRATSELKSTEERIMTLVKAVQSEKQKIVSSCLPDANAKLCNSMTGMGLP